MCPATGPVPQALLEPEAQPYQGAADHEQMEPPGLCRASDHELKVEDVDVDDEKRQAIASEHSLAQDPSEPEARHAGRGPDDAEGDPFALVAAPTDVLFEIPEYGQKPEREVDGKKPKVGI